MTRLPIWNLPSMPERPRSVSMSDAMPMKRRRLRPGTSRKRTTWKHGPTCGPSTVPRASCSRSFVRSIARWTRPRSSGAAHGPRRRFVPTISCGRRGSRRPEPISRPGGLAPCMMASLREALRAAPLERPRSFQTSPAPPTPATEHLTVVLRPDPSLWDGTFANNAWLQECPKPLTKQVWGNALALNPQEAARLGLSSGDVVTLAADGRQIEAPVVVEPGVADGVAGLTLGLGRRNAGAIGNGIGANAFAIRTAADLWTIPEATITKTGRRRGNPDHPERGAHAGRRARTLSAARLLQPGQAERLRANAPAEPDAGTAASRRWPCLGDGDRCLGLHRLQRLCRGVPVGEQRARGRPGRSRPRPRHALAARRCLRSRLGRAAEAGLSAGPLHALRTCALRAGVSGGGLACMTAKD